MSRDETPALGARGMCAPRARRCCFVSLGVSVCAVAGTQGAAVGADGGGVSVWGTLAAGVGATMGAAGVGAAAAAAGVVSRSVISLWRPAVGCRAGGVGLPLVAPSGGGGVGRLSRASAAVGCAVPPTCGNIASTAVR